MTKTSAVAKTLAVTIPTAFLVSIGTAQAQVKVPPGQDFYATPIAHDIPATPPEAKITPAAPAPAAKKKMMKKKKH